MTAVDHYLGFDPGGQIGVALLTAENGQRRCVTYSAISVDDALNWAIKKLDNQTPDAAGLDTFLYWETGNSGWREADRWLRDEYSAVRNSVLSSNSAAGAMSVQGMALAILLRKRWPQIALIETHPKVLYYALANRTYDFPSDMPAWLAKQTSCAFTEFTNDHCWDAAVSAWAALEGHKRCWKRDLRALSIEAVEPAGPAAFWWP